MNTPRIGIAGLSAVGMLIACSSAAPAPPPPAPTPAPTAAPADAPPAAVAARQPCVCPPDEGAWGPAPAPRSETVMAGQMTEEAAQAKRLYDSERWADARMLLDRVVRGDTGDDLGNRQIAEYHSAIASYRLEEHERALEQLSAIARSPNHLKHDDTLLWLVKLSEVPELCASATEEVRRYSHERVSHFCEKLANDAPR